MIRRLFSPPSRPRRYADSASNRAPSRCEDFGDDRRNILRHWQPAPPDQTAPDVLANTSAVEQPVDERARNPSLNNQQGEDA